jgi:hypothetical protein
MAAIQTLLDNAISLMIDKRAPSAQSISRAQHLRTQTRGDAVYKFTVGMHPALKYEDHRDLLEDYDTTGRIVEEEVTLSNVSGGSWIMSYQGGFTTVDLNAITADGNSFGSSLVCNVSATVAASTEVFVEKGDYIQVDGSRYPYQATARVLRGSGDTVTVPLNRPIVPEDGFTIGGQDILVGTDCTFRVRMIQQPTYSVVPGRYIQWDGDMQLMEVLE